MLDLIVKCPLGVFKILDIVQSFKVTVFGVIEYFRPGLALGDAPISMVPEAPFCCCIIDFDFNKYEGNNVGFCVLGEFDGIFGILSNEDFFDKSKPFDPEIVNLRIFEALRFSCNSFCFILS